jgi:tetratricopeptide (TPR) repeat protein
MSCHDPHYTPDGAKEKIAFYRKKCLTCHTGNTFASAHHPENPDCTSCHMPRTGAENIAHVAWTDHRILKLPEALRTAAKSGSGDTLVPVFSAGATQRDMALAYYKSFLEGNVPMQQKAYEKLKTTELSGDNAALVALGVLSEGRGDLKQAQALFEDVLKRDPLNLIAISNLGTLLAKSGDLQGAISLWRPAFERNEDVVGLAKNLARVECAAGDAAAAHATLQKTLQYSPGIRDVRQLMTQLQDCSPQK